MRARVIAAVIVLIPLAAIGGDHDAAGEGKAPLFDNLGSHHHTVTTTSKEAQRYFDQGLTLCFAFNHPEAIKSLQEAARLDPRCAMAQWGIAFAYGANINMPMTDEAVPKAYAALQKAQELAPKATAREQAYINALAKRYAEKPTKDRAPLDKAFADAMREVVRQFPDDADAATLFAEALMDTMPWNYWAESGLAKPETVEVLAALEGVLARHPNHIGACHYYIHAVEASPNPERGLAAAHRLRDLVPGAGHLVHMPSHIYLRVGDYHEAALCNERAAAVDEAYIAKHKVTSMYAGMYYPHNLHFLWYALAMEGRCEDSVRIARKVAGLPVPHGMDMPEIHWVKASPYLALARFGRWDEVLREPDPGAALPFESALWHFARGLAFARKRQLPDAERELQALDAATQDKAIEALEQPTFPGAQLIKIARAVLAAEVAGLRGDAEARLKGLADAVALQDKLPYMEPPFWYFPIRQLHGAALVQTGRFADAEAVYREDLKRHPANGWSLFGLLQCHRAAGSTEPAAAVERQFREAWRFADVALTGSFF